MESSQGISQGVYVGQEYDVLLAPHHPLRILLTSGFDSVLALIQQGIDKMAGTQAELDAAIANLQTTVSNIETTVVNAVNKLQAISAPIDLTTEINELNAFGSSLQAANTNLTNAETPASTVSSSTSGSAASGSSATTSTTVG